MRRQLAAKEVAAAALTLDSIGRYRSIDGPAEHRDETASSGNAAFDERE